MVNRFNNLLLGTLVLLLLVTKIGWAAHQFEHDFEHDSGSEGGAHCAICLTGQLLDYSNIDTTAALLFEQKPNLSHSYIYTCHWVPVFSDYHSRAPPLSSPF